MDRGNGDLHGEKPPTPRYRAQIRPFGRVNGLDVGIPADPQVAAAGVTQIAGDFRLYGGTITTITGPPAYTYPNGSGFTGDQTARIEINFTTTVANPSSHGAATSQLEPTGDPAVPRSPPQDRRITCGLSLSTAPAVTRTVRYRLEAVIFPAGPVGRPSRYGEAMRRVPRWGSISAIAVVLAVVISLAVTAASSIR
jgi:hypothetical protein